MFCFSFLNVNSNDLKEERKKTPNRVINLLNRIGEHITIRTAPQHVFQVIQKVTKFHQSEVAPVCSINYFTG